MGRTQDHNAARQASLAASHPASGAHGIVVFSPKTYVVLSHGFDNGNPDGSFLTCFCLNFCRFPWWTFHIADLLISGVSTTALAFFLHLLYIPLSGAAWRDYDPGTLCLPSQAFWNLGGSHQDLLSPASCIPIQQVSGRQCQGLTPSWAVTRPPEAMTALVPECLGGLAWWNNFLGCCASRKPHMVSSQRKFFFGLPLSLQLVWSCWLQQAILSVVSV